MPREFSRRVLAQRTSVFRAVVGLTLIGVAGCTDTAPVPISLAAQGVYAAALSEDAELAVIGSMNHGASLWRRSSHERLFSWNHAQDEYTSMVSMAFSPDGRRAATSDPRTLVVWDTEAGQHLAFWGLPAAALDLALANDGRKVLLGLEDHSALLFDAANGDHLQTFLHEGVVGSVAMNHSASIALTGSDDETARVWDLTSGAERFRLDHDNPVRTVALSADGSLGLTASQNRKVRIWDLTTGLVVRELFERNPGITSARFSADGSLLLLGMVNRTVELFNVISGERLERWHLASSDRLRTSGRAVLDVAFGQSGTQFFSIAGSGDVSTLVAR